ncbi:hypothetical protein A9168_16420 [Macellibacteroides sp. HH-ZS]|nr:hypothetical protein A9168_16420 [Macellibacteroides sp. HH-ZS]
MKISKELKEKFHTNYSDTTKFASKARLLQSIWRTEKGFEYDEEKLGNYLIEKNAINNGENFLTKKIFELVKNVVNNNSDKKKVIQEPRIWTNLLSSQPMAFNMFGELVENLDLCKKTFEELYPEREINEILRIEFEYSPERKSGKYTNDNSAFDVFIEYMNNRDEKCFFGIEVKYAENLNDKPSSHKNEYEVVADKSMIFRKESIDSLKEKPIQQIWRDHLLALSMFMKSNDYKIGDFIYLYPSENKNCRIGIEKYKETFKESVESYFKPLTLEKLVGVVKKYCADNWINEFENRYLNFDKIIKASL